MGYEIQLQSKILALLELFRDHAPDKETSAWTIELVADEKKWPQAHALFDRVRDRCLTAKGDAGRPTIPFDREDRARVEQYGFEELCLKTIFNETNTDCPFDAGSPFWVVSSAIRLARALEIPVESVIAVIAPQAGCSAS